VTDKPFDLIVEETRIKLQEVLDNSGLPVTVLAMILREMSSAVSRREIAQIHKLQQIEDQRKEN